ncbi:MAG: hypothetical protein IIA61_01200 [Candidatus Marinimicrobia bacterium]|nr:hypothetical protein [Candidatus Neomarinimicrobiota bacterium]
MSNTGKQISNPASTGGLGIHFENRVQTSFVVLMLAGGFAPCLPTWPIVKIKLQGKYKGFETDDIIVYVQQPESERQAKLLCQIKHKINFTKRNKILGEVIQSAWNDYNNAKIFSKTNDAIALISGPLSSRDTDSVRSLLHQAEHSENADDFIARVDLGKFTSNDQRAKLQIFKEHLKNANDGIDLTDDQVFRFLKSFHLLIYDLDIKGVTLSLLHTIIGQYSHENTNALWAQIKDHVEWESEHAGFVTTSTIDEGISSVFKKAPLNVIPSDLIEKKIEVQIQDWNQHKYANELAIANLIGSWDDKADNDRAIISQLAREEYSSWILKIREVLQDPNSPINLKNGIWKIKDRKSLWLELGTRIFDDNLDLFKQCAVSVLTERDPKFELSKEDRFAASLYDKVPKYSTNLRTGLAEGLALIACYSSVLVNCSMNKCETSAVLTIREIFQDSDWILWASLNSLLPVLAESSPDEFLISVEKAIKKTPCPITMLFSEEGDGITGSNYMTGLLWSLEALAWEEQYLVRVSVILGELASLDPGGNWGNRPSNSLSTIFLPWLPQTLASFDKRKVAMQTLLNENPDITWQLLVSLLPNQHQTSSGSYKPRWRNISVEGINIKIKKVEYFEQVSFYADLAVKMAKDDHDKLNELIGHLDNLPKVSFDKILNHLESQAIIKIPESQRLNIWEGLTDFASKHKRFSDTEWALSGDIVTKIEEVANALSPKNPLNLYRRLFNEHNYDLYEKNEDWQTQQKKLEKRKQKAIKDILDSGGKKTILKFVEMVESPMGVGDSYGSLADVSVDSDILPSLIGTENKNFEYFISGYVWSRHKSQGWEWVDNIEMENLTIQQIARFLSYLPFTSETWKRVYEHIPKSEGDYWSQVIVNPYQTDGDINMAVDKLIKYGRPNSAIKCLSKNLHIHRQLDIQRAIKALLSALSSKEIVDRLDAYDTIEIIKFLQEDSDVNPDDLFRIEWAYLPLLDGHSGARPKLLENRLITDPNFFCDVIRLIYRSKDTPKTEQEPSKQEKTVASNASRSLEGWHTPPGTQTDGSFSGDKLNEWLDEIIKSTEKSGHLEVALSHVGKVLFYCPSDVDGLWINKFAAEALNNKDNEDMRSGFYSEIFNSRGAHFVDPTSKPEKELASEWRKKADEVENNGYHRLASTLKAVSESYDREAIAVVEEHKLLTEV